MLSQSQLLVPQVVVVPLLVVVMKVPSLLQQLWEPLPHPLALLHSASRHPRPPSAPSAFPQQHLLSCLVSEKTKSTKGDNRARQARYTTTLAFGNCTWHASKYKVHKLHQRYSHEKRTSSVAFTPHFRHTRQHRCVRVYYRTNFYSRPDIVWLNI